LTLAELRTLRAWANATAGGTLADAIRLTVMGEAEEHAENRRETFYSGTTRRHPDP
jgi:hypothetical protein